MRSVFRGLIIIATMLLTWQGGLLSQHRVEVPCYYEVAMLSSQLLDKDMGLKEATGNNDGEHIKLYMKAVGLNYNKHYPYCMAGQYYYFKTAADLLHKPCPIVRTASTIKIYEWGVKNGVQTIYEPKENDLVVWKTLNKSTGHVARIKQVLDRGNIITWECNTGNGMTGSQRDGNGNYIRKRNIYTPIGRMRIRGLIGFKYEYSQNTSQSTFANENKCSRHL